MLLPALASAAPPEKPAAEPPAEKPATKAKAQPKKGGRKKIDLGDDFLVEGRLEKPNAFILFRRSAMEYDWARLDAQFTPLVLESVQDPLF